MERRSKIEAQPPNLRHRPRPAPPDRQARRRYRGCATRCACPPSGSIRQIAGADGKIIPLRDQVHQPVGRFDRHADLRVAGGELPHQRGDAPLPHGGRAGSPPLPRSRRLFPPRAIAGSLSRTIVRNTAGAISSSACSASSRTGAASPHDMTKPENPISASSALPQHSCGCPLSTA